MTRRVYFYRLQFMFIAFALLLPLGTVQPVWGAQGEPDSYSIGLTPVFLDDQTSFLNDWQFYLTSRLGSSVKFVRRQSYREITELLLDGRIDVAWICGYPYVRNWHKLKLLAVPLFANEPLYQSYLIVPEDEQSTEKIADLRDKIFAFSDPDSNSGYLVPQVELKKSNIKASDFFRRTFFTWSHRDVVKAVANGVAQAGAVDGYVWETLALTHPKLTGKTRVVRKSDFFGFPPFVSRPNLSSEKFEKIRKVLLDMANDPGGQQLLKRLNLDGFTEGDDALYYGIRKLVAQLGQE